MVKEDIIKSALELFLAKRSCKNVTMDEIASELAISKRTLYEHFENKKALILECMNLATNDVYHKCEEMKSESKHAFDYFFRSIGVIQSGLKEVAILANEIKKVYPEIFKQIVSSHVIFAKTNTTFFFNKAKQDGFIRDDIDEQFFISMMEMNMVHSSDSEFLNKNRNFGEDNIKIKVFYTIIRGISSVKGVEYVDEVIKNKELQNTNNLQQNEKECFFKD